MKTLVVDFSPILYSNFISAGTEMSGLGLKPDPTTKKLPITSDFKSIIIYKVFEELTTLKYKFGVDEIVIASDNAEGGYWRKDVYPIYKGKRKKTRKESNLDWDGAFKVFEEIKEALKSTSFKLIDIPKVEGDDVMFVLSEYLSVQNIEVILHSVDHDTVYNLKHQGVKWYRHVKTARKEGAFQTPTPQEIEEFELIHLIEGDYGDNIKNVKAYSRFSKDFKALYPDKTEALMYPRRFELERLFLKKYKKEAYNHPRYGYKMFCKTDKTLEEFINGLDGVIFFI